MVKKLTKEVLKNQTGAMDTSYENKELERPLLRIKADNTSVDTC